MAVWAKSRWKLGMAALTGAACAMAQSATPSRPSTVAVRSGELGATIPPGGASAVFGGMIFSPPGLSKPIEGKPYSAEQITEHVQTLADGTHITQTTQSVKFYRDSEARTRTEHSFSLPGASDGASPTFIEITDPAAGYRYLLSSQNHQARRMSLPGAMNRTGAAGPAALPAHSRLSAIRQGTAIVPANRLSAMSATDTGRAQPQISHENLGTQTIEGVIAEGTRTTITYPEGFFGNDRPITSVSESWTSSELGIVVLSKNSDPRMGETVTKLTNISQSEPDPSLFQVPPDYTVVGEETSQGVH